VRRAASAVAAAGALLALVATSSVSLAWFDQTHLAVAKAAGYRKWYNAAGADIAKLKAGDREAHNHFVNNARGTVITPEMVLAQVERYNQPDPGGHLYGAIVASVRDYIAARKKGRYGEFHLAYTVHYVGDLSQPLHHTQYDEFNKRNHSAMDGVVDDEVMDHLDRIAIYPVHIASEQDLCREIARIANLSLALGYRLEDEDRLLTREEAYRQLSHSASVLHAVLGYARERSAAGRSGIPHGKRREPQEHRSVRRSP